MKRILSVKEKNLVYNDLCMRLPYHPKLSVPANTDDSEPDECVVCRLTDIDSYTGLIGTDYADGLNINEVMAYLRPITDITDDELRDFVKTCWTDGEVVEIEREEGGFVIKTYDYDFNESYDTLWIEGISHLNYDPIHSIHWLLMHHFDIFGLVPRGLALPALPKMYDRTEFRERWEG